MTQILNHAISFDPLQSRPLPGLSPFDLRDWIEVNETYAAQMRERRALLQSHRDQVLWLDPVAQDAAEELLSRVLAHLPQPFGHDHCCGGIVCPDGRVVRPDSQTPLESLNAITAEDYCILLKEGDAFVLRGGLLSFPAGWSLAEKAGQPMGLIHDRVEPFDDGVAKRVAKLLDGIQPDRPLWRHNALWYSDPALFQPRAQPTPDRRHAPFLRTERQCLLRLPRSGALVFSILTHVVARETLAAK